jgi:hypothetical protein
VTENIEETDLSSCFKWLSHLTPEMVGGALGLTGSSLALGRAKDWTSIPSESSLALYIWKVAAWYIPLLDGLYHVAIGIYHWHVVYTIWYIP